MSENKRASAKKNEESKSSVNLNLLEDVLQEAKHSLDVLQHENAGNLPPLNSDLDKGENYPNSIEIRSIDNSTINILGKKNGAITIGFEGKDLARQDRNSISQ